MSVGAVIELFRIVVEVHTQRKNGIYQTAGKEEKAQEIAYEGYIN